MHGSCFRKHASWHSMWRSYCDFTQHSIVNNTMVFCNLQPSLEIQPTPLRHLSLFLVSWAIISNITNCAITITRFLYLHVRTPTHLVTPFPKIYHWGSSNLQACKHLLTYYNTLIKPSWHLICLDHRLHKHNRWCDIFKREKSLGQPLQAIL